MSRMQMAETPMSRQRWTRSGARWVLPALVIATSACAAGSSRTGDDEVFGGGRGARPARLAVRNNNFNDATIYAVTSAERLRLGTVTGKTDAVLTLPDLGRPDPIYLEIDLVGGERCRTDTLVVDPGDDLQLEIWPQLSSMPECR